MEAKNDPRPTNSIVLVNGVCLFVNKNPAMPSVASTTEAALKIATAREGFAQTDFLLEMIGFDQADIRRIRAQEQRQMWKKKMAHTC